MNKILLFGGTTEGRLAAELIATEKIPFTLCVATDYGAELMPEHLKPQTRVGRLDLPQMINFINNGHFTHVVDATHPYAVLASENIKAACAHTGAHYLRLLRDSDDEKLPAGALSATDTTEAARILTDISGPVFLATGIKEVPDFLGIPDASERLFVRVLPNAEALISLKTAGLPGAHIICMQGPFDTDMNTATLRHIRKVWSQAHPEQAEADLILVTKESGNAGGFREKCEAAEMTGARLLVIGRPRETEGISPEEFEDYIRSLGSKTAGIRDIWVIGLGMSSVHLTREADAALRACDLIIGAGRMLDMTAEFGKETFCSYDYPEITRYLQGHPEYRRIAVVFSGDIGFYSGAARMRQCLEGLPFEVHAVSGIPSPVHFLNTIGKTWADVHLASLHGRTSAVTALVRVHEKTLFLLGKETDVSDICRRLIDSGLGNTAVTIGTDLMTDAEQIISGSPADFVQKCFSPLGMIYIENPAAKQAPAACALDDHVFMRGSVPMTKAPVRAQVLSALQLTSHAVLYDIGAGTGSVSIAAARSIPEGTVYAIEKNPEALALIDCNCMRLQADNVITCPGSAPDITDIPQPPTHAFIGGSSGNFKEIILWLKKLNPNCRIVMTAVTLETISRVLDCCHEMALGDPEIVHIQASRAKKAGASHLMQAENPVWIICVDGKTGDVPVS